MLLERGSAENPYAPVAAERPADEPTAVAQTSAPAQIQKGAKTRRTKVKA